jgi:hypothetical protein
MSKKGGFQRLIVDKLEQVDLRLPEIIFPTCEAHFGGENTFT